MLQTASLKELIKAKNVFLFITKVRGCLVWELKCMFIAGVWITLNKMSTEKTTGLSLCFVLRRADFME